MKHAFLVTHSQYQGLINILSNIGIQLKAGLHYGGEMHRSVKKFSPRHAFEAREGMPEKIQKIIKYSIQVEFSGELPLWHPCPKNNDHIR